LTSQDRLTALVGSVARQPTYSSAHPQHQTVMAKNIWLEGKATQYVIDFGFPTNHAFASRVHGACRF
jgi:hypothetical protein